MCRNRHSETSASITPDSTVTHVQKRPDNQVAAMTSSSAHDTKTFVPNGETAVKNTYRATNKDRHDSRIRRRGRLRGPGHLKDCLHNICKLKFHQVGRLVTHRSRYDKPPGPELLRCPMLVFGCAAQGALPEGFVLDALTYRQNAAPSSYAGRCCQSIDTVSERHSGYAFG